MSSHIRLFATPWTSAHKASLSSIISQSWLKFASIESVMLSNHLILASLFSCLPSFPASGFPGGSTGKDSACNVGNLGSIPGMWRYSGEGNGYPHQYSGLENSMGWIAHRVTKSWTPLNDFHFTFPASGSFPMSWIFTRLVTKLLDISNR